MALVKVKEIYRKAREGGYGVGGFCAENLEMVQAILSAAQETCSPVVVMLWEEDIKAVGPGYLESIVRYGATQVDVPVAIMLDHGMQLADCLWAMLNGHTGVMIDASHRDLEQNIQTTREVVEIAHMADLLVEGELGTVRRSFEMTGPYSEETVFTDPVLLTRYVQETDVDSVAISVGTESGITKAPPVIDFDRLTSIRNSTDAYLTIHGGSGTDPQDVCRAILNGVTAFRFASEIRVAFLEALTAAKNNLPPDFPDTRLIFQPARKAASEVVKARMEQLGCVGKAW